MNNLSTIKIQDQILFQRLLSNISLQLLNAREDEMNQTMELLLYSIGVFLHVDSTFLQVFNEKNLSFQEIYHWDCPWIEQQEFFSVSDWLPDSDLWASWFANSDRIQVSDVKFLSTEASSLKDFLCNHSIQSLYVITLKLDKNLIGVFGCLQFAYNRYWTEQDSDILKSASDSLINFYKHKYTEDKLRRHLAFEKLLAKFSRSFINIRDEDIDNSIELLMASIGKFVGVDTTYLILFSEESFKVAKVYQWAAEGIIPDKNRKIGDPIDASIWHLRKLKNNEIIQISDIQDLPIEADIEKETWQQQGIKSVVGIPLVINDKLIGYFSLDTRRYYKKWDTEDVYTLSAVGDIITNLFFRKEYEKELIQAKIAAELANSAKEVFLTNISHEYRTPINVIFATLQLMESTLTDPNRKEEYSNIAKYSKMMKQNCYRLLRLVNNMIDVTKIESGYYTLHLQNCNIVSVIEEITMSVVEYAKLKGIRIIFDTDIEEKIMACDSDQIERILLNLLSNSIKYAKPIGWINVCLTDAGDKLLLSVKDNGIGIPPSHIDTIFDRFIQMNDTYIKSSEGSGIGLSLARSLIELHGGKISVQSDVGIGSEFFIELPVRIVDDVTSQTKELKSLENDPVEKINIEFSDIYF